MKKCKGCQWHKSNLAVVYETIRELTQGGYEDLMVDFEHSLCWSQGCKEPAQKYMDKYGDEVARKARLQLRSDMGIVEFTAMFPRWAKELATQEQDSDPE